MNIIEAITTNTLSDLDRTILETSRESFLVYGYAGTNLDTIAQSVGIGKGTIYRHFQSKAFLFVCVVLYTYQQMLAHFLPIPNIADPEEAFHRYLTTLIKLNTTLSPFFALLNPMEFGREFQHDCGEHPEIQQIIQRFQKEKNEGILLLANLIEKLQSAGIVRNPSSPRTLATMIFALINTFFREDEKREGLPTHNPRDLVDFIYRGLDYTKNHISEDTL